MISASGECSGEIIHLQYSMGRFCLLHALYQIVRAKPFLHEMKKVFDLTCRIQFFIYKASYVEYRVSCAGCFFCKVCLIFYFV